ncbi:hypothetical protein [Rhizobium sp. FY34]|uniref:hypothetical protein n=1 Tax=Rhizobium sp. FY34 TaxID=2562309 RepID=UPI0010C110C1|nr:hypothetical protein [Rhizobium sp. FY34]
MFLDGSVTTHFVIGIALLAMALSGCSKRVSSAGIAVAAMPFAATALALIHHDLGLHVISDFNTWDLVKDVPMWLGGTYFQFVVVSAITYFICWCRASGWSAAQRWLIRGAFGVVIASACVNFYEMASLPGLVAKSLRQTDLKFAGNSLGAPVLSRRVLVPSSDFSHPWIAFRF